MRRILFLDMEGPVTFIRHRIMALPGIPLCHPLVFPGNMYLLIALGNTWWQPTAISCIFHPMLEWHGLIRQLVNLLATLRRLVNLLDNHLVNHLDNLLLVVSSRYCYMLFLA